MATHSSILAWRISWTEEPGGPQSMGSLRVNTTERLHFHFSLSCIGKGNGYPLQCSCLENPRDGGALRAAVYGVTQSRTRLKRLSSNLPSSSSCDSGKAGASCGVRQSQTGRMFLSFSFRKHPLGFSLFSLHSCLLLHERINMDLSFPWQPYDVLSSQDHG